MFHGNISETTGDVLLTGTIVNASAIVGALAELLLKSVPENGARHHYAGVRTGHSVNRTADVPAEPGDTGSCGQPGTGRPDRGFEY